MALHRIPPSFAPIFPGIYSIDPSGSGLTPAMFEASDIFSMNGISIPTHPSYESIGPSLTGNFLDPTLYGDMAMYAQRTCFDAANTLMYNQMSNYGVFNEGISGFDY